MAERAAEFDAIIGHHLECAYRLREELRPVSEEDRALAKDAARRLASAGERAFGRSDMRAAASLLDRAVALLSEGDPLLIELLPDLGRAVAEVGDLTKAFDVLRDAGRVAAAAGDRRAEARARITHLELLPNVDSSFSLERGILQLDALIDELDSAGDARSLAQAHRLGGMFRYWSGHAEAAEGAFERAAGYARLVGDKRQEAESLSWLMLAIGDGPSHAVRGLERIAAVLQQAEGHGETQARALCVRGYLQTMAGDLADAHASLERSRRVFEDLGLAWGMLSVVPPIWARIEIARGEPEAAERELRDAYEALDRMGEKANLSTVAGELAGVLHLLGRDEEAARFTEISEQAATPDDVLSQILWRCTRALVLADRGDRDVAERLAREAVAIADGTDYLDNQGDALMALAEVMLRCERLDAAREAAQDALALYERKGNVVSAGRARKLIESVGSTGA